MIIGVSAVGTAPLGDGSYSFAVMTARATARSSQSAVVKPQYRASAVAVPSIMLKGHSSQSVSMHGSMLSAISMRTPGSHVAKLVAHAMATATSDKFALIPAILMYGRVLSKTAVRTAHHSLAPLHSSTTASVNGMGSMFGSILLTGAIAATQSTFKLVPSPFAALSATATSAVRVSPRFNPAARLVARALSTATSAIMLTPTQLLFARAINAIRATSKSSQSVSLTSLSTIKTWSRVTSGGQASLVAKAKTSARVMGGGVGATFFYGRTAISAAVKAGNASRVYMSGVSKAVSRLTAPMMPKAFMGGAIHSVTTTATIDSLLAKLSAHTAVSMRTTADRVGKFLGTGRTMAFSTAAATGQFASSMSGIVTNYARASFSRVVGPRPPLPTFTANEPVDIYVDLDNE